MGINAHVIRPYQTTNQDHQVHQQAERQFLGFFISSPEFDIRGLRFICKQYNLPHSSAKSDLTNAIAVNAFEKDVTLAPIIEALLCKEKGWVSIKSGSSLSTVQGKDPYLLLTKPGEEAWHGPITLSGDHEANWYIRPIFIKHWEILEEGEAPVETQIRWLVFR